MRLKQPLDNGNLALHRGEVESRLNFDNSSWLLNNTANNSDSRTANSLLNSNYDGSRESSNGTESVDNIRNTAAEVNVVCNRQYRLNTENSGLFFLLSENKPTGNLEGVAQTQLAVRESFLGTSDASLSPSPLEEERAFSQSDTDEMSESSSQPVNPVPRGIVNPNYPGFQHLAHTLQDYSTNIDNFSLSENDMTDDDVDITDITENTYDSKDNNNGFVETKKNINNNTIYSETILACENHTPLKPLDIPDLLKTITLNNNNNTISHDYEERFPCTDIENNFDTKDIIGDFNKEIEDEIKQLLNYNINIQSDLEELKKDIKANLAKPIENTINNISDVVNHVIKKLVETQGETCEQNDIIDEIYGQREVSNTVNEENETNIRTEMSKINLSRPTFLLIDNNTHVIPDAFLSDGVEEININEEKYSIESISDSVDKTIQKLGTELRNIIPKLDEKREQEIITVKETEVVPLATDGNSNEIATSSLESDKKLPSAAAKLNVTRKTSVCHTRVAKVPATTKTASRKTSVHATESVQEADLGSFDVYNIETALPKLDFDAIESHLKAAKEAERRKHNDREEIRRRLATGVDAEDYHSLGHGDRPGRKPSLHSRLKSGKNLQICYMNETASDNESQSSETEKNPNPSVSLSHSNTFSKSNSNHPYQTRPLSVYITKEEKLSTIQSAVKLRPPLISRSKSRSAQSLSHIGLRESDFYALQATLQTEARIALAQAKETARVQMERERRTRAVSPVTEMLRHSMQKAGAPLAADRRRVSRQLLTDMNVAQLQVIVNELHSQIEALNESLVSLLMARDELHMGQDSMLVDIEDLTRYLGVKEQTKKTKGSKSGVRRLTSFVHK